MNYPRDFDDSELRNLPHETKVEILLIKILKELKEINYYVSAQ